MQTRHGITILLMLAAWSLPGPSAGQQPDGAPIRMRTLRPGDILYVLLGGGGNSLALMRDDGIVLIDSKLAARGKEIAGILESVSDRPVTTLINTHAHADHTG